MGDEVFAGRPKRLILFVLFVSRNLRLRCSKGKGDSTGPKKRTKSPKWEGLEEAAMDWWKYRYYEAQARITARGWRARGGSRPAGGSPGEDRREQLERGGRLQPSYRNRAWFSRQVAATIPRDG